MDETDHIEVTKGLSLATTEYVGLFALYLGLAMLTAATWGPVLFPIAVLLVEWAGS